MRPALCSTARGSQRPCTQCGKTLSKLRLAMGSGDPQSNRNSGKAGTASRSCRAAIGTHSQVGTARSERANLAFSPLLTPSRPDLLLLAPAGETPLLSAPGAPPAAGLATLVPRETGSSLAAGLPHWLGIQTVSGAPRGPSEQGQARRPLLAEAVPSPVPAQGSTCGHS